MFYVLYYIFIPKKISQRKESVIKKIIRKRTYIYSIAHIYEKNPHLSGPGHFKSVV